MSCVVNCATAKSHSSLKFTVHVSLKLTAAPDCGKLVTPITGSNKQHCLLFAGDRR